MEPLHHLIYQSKATMVFSGPQVSQLLNCVQQRNQAAGITGMLWYDGRRFLQIMEGPASTLEHVFSRICLDCRHTRVQVLANGPIGHRQFTTCATAIVSGSHPEDGSAPGSPHLAEQDEALWLLLEDFRLTAPPTALLVAAGHS
ncbi:BLUF domain-containing protein [Hymenobacter sp. NST-14]|uniref:BLUF domain-containing protein n=1 Tax=Hymenobacter piscis TaxID=2839984 RepID=UPI001C00EB40|nr:BLUF domain-containing protein [Hymenobacter piscis]MBT9392750.1 BLUF domain-containing protein [Hymenobacter piscis]